MIVGNKARGLQILQEHGFNVPEFFVLPPSYAGKPKFIRDALRKQLDPKKYYAVRSSGTKEDMPEFSFAGQYHTSLNARGIDEVIAEVKTCYESVSSDTVQAYLKQNDLSATDLQLAVVIQEMVQPDHSPHIRLFDNRRNFKLKNNLYAINFENNVIRPHSLYTETSVLF